MSYRSKKKKKKKKKRALGKCAPAEEERGGKAKRGHIGGVWGGMEWGERVTVDFPAVLRRG